jgi:prepilin peptidase CpaA
VAQAFVIGSLITPTQSLLGLLLGFAIPLVLFIMGALGGGDVKLLAAVGAWLGPVLVFKVILAAAVVGLVIVLVQATTQGRLRTLFRNSTVLTVNMVNMDVVGMETVTATGKSCRSVDRPLPYAVPVLVAVLLILMVG